jgi:hypothetical protein
MGGVPVDVLIIESISDHAGVDGAVS